MSRRALVTLSAILALGLASTSAPACGCGGVSMAVTPAMLMLSLFLPIGVFKAAAIQNRLGLKSVRALLLATWITIVSTTAIVLVAALVPATANTMTEAYTGGIFLLPFLIAVSFALEIRMMRPRFPDLDARLVRRAVLDANVVTLVFVATLMAGMVYKYEHALGNI